MNVYSICRVFILILVIQLGACVNAPQSNQQAAQQQEKVQQVESYCDRLYADSLLDPIRRKVPIKMNLYQTIPVEMMGDSQFPTEDEAKLVLLWAQLRQDCITHSTQVLGPPPAHQSAVRMANSQAMAALFARRITYGQLAGQINQNQMAFLQQDQALRSQAQRDAAQAQQAFAQNLLQQQQINLQRQQAQNQQLRPPPVSNSVNCTTQYIGNTAYTSCH